MSDYIQKANDIKTELNKLLLQLDRLNDSQVSSEDFSQLRETVRSNLIRLQTDIEQLKAVDEQHFFPGNPLHDERQRVLIADVESIGVDLQFEINPRVEKILQDLLSQAKAHTEKQEQKSQKWYVKAHETVTKSLEVVGTPLAKLAAMMGALEKIAKFLVDHMN